jgi:hypothetical protein
MKTILHLSLFAAVALLPACTSTTQTAWRENATSARYASNSTAQPASPAEGPGTDIPAEGPADVNVNPAYMPTPLLRTSAAGGP